MSDKLRKLIATHQNYAKSMRAEPRNRVLEFATELLAILNAESDRIEADERAVPVAWMTHHDDPMLFTTAEDAAAYCDDDETPIALFTHPPAQAAQDVRDTPEYSFGYQQALLDAAKFQKANPDHQVEMLIARAVVSGVVIPEAPTAELVAQSDGGRFRKKPVVIDAVQWFKDGDHPAVIRKSDPNRYADEGIPWVPTLEGGHVVSPGDWIITGVKGEHYPCKPDIFAMTYEPATQPHSPDAADSGRVDGNAVERAAKAMWEVVPRGVPWSGEVTSASEWRMLARAALAAQPQSATAPVDTCDAVAYFSADPAEGEFSTHETLADAQAAAEKSLEYAQDAAGEAGWADEPPQICYGIVLGHCIEREGSRKPAPEGSDFSEMIDFRLTDLSPTPAASPVGVPDGIALAASFIQKKADDYAEENCSSEPDTGATVYHFGNAGMEYHHTLIELAEEIAALAAPSATPEGGEVETCDGCGSDNLILKCCYCGNEINPNRPTHPAAGETP